VGGDRSLSLFERAPHRNRAAYLVRRRAIDSDRDRVESSCFTTAAAIRLLDPFVTLR
jgi:hypothetical protein